MQQIIECLNSGEMILLVGSGVSAELGLPTWPALCEKLRAQVPIGVAGRDEAERLLAKARYSEFMGWMERFVGREALRQLLGEILADTGTIGPISSLLARLPFKQVLTTNFDGTLGRHFEAAGRYVPIVVNTKEGLSSIVLDSTFSMIKLHSDLDHSDTLIVTAEDYDRASQAGEWQYFRDFLLTVFTRNVLIVGYSVTDPDINIVLTHLRQNLARPNSLHAILADAEQKMFDDSRINITSTYTAIRPIKAITPSSTTCFDPWNHSLLRPHGPDPPLN